MSTSPEEIVVIPQTTKVIQCGKCGRNMVVTMRTVLAYCQGCSSHLGVKR